VRSLASGVWTLKSDIVLMLACDAGVVLLNDERIR